MTASTDISMEIATLRRDVQYLKDRTDILDCINRHARGCDRHDIALITSTYHQEGVDEHGSVVNSGPEYGGWANASHAATSQVHTHNITTHTCEIDGNTAHAESYVNVILLGNDGRTAQFISGRYLDRLERAGRSMADRAAPLDRRGHVHRRCLCATDVVLSATGLCQGQPRPARSLVQPPAHDGGSCNAVVDLHSCLTCVPESGDMGQMSA